MTSPPRIGLPPTVAVIQSGASAEPSRSSPKRAEIVVRRSTEVAPLSGAAPTRSSPVARFIRRLENRAFRRSLASKLITIKEGDWQAVVEIAAAEGFRFSVEELKAAMPDAFFKGAGKRPRRFWSRSTLEL